MPLKAFIKKGCKVCTSELREPVLKQYTELGWSPDRILSWLSEQAATSGTPFSVARSSLYNHLERHTGERLGARAQEKALTLKAQHMIDTGTLPEITIEEFLSKVIAVGAQKAHLATPRDGIAAAKLQNEILVRRKEDFWNDVAQMICIRQPEKKILTVEPEPVPAQVTEPTKDQQTQDVEFIKSLPKLSVGNSQNNGW